MDTHPKSGSGKSGSAATTGLEIYKRGQGKLSRGGAYLLGALLVISGGTSLYRFINVPGHEWVKSVPLIGSISIYNTIAFGVVLLGLLALHLILNRPKMVDGLIETEQELKKVSWPSRREVKNATIVVSLVTFSMAFLLFGFDKLLHWAFQLVY